MEIQGKIQIDNKIIFQKDKDETHYYHFGNFKLIQNGKVVINKENVAYYSICEVDFKNKVNYIAGGRNGRCSGDDCELTLNKPLTNYYIVLQIVYNSGILGCIHDPFTHINYSFTTEVYYDGKLIDNMDGSIHPIINCYNELLYDYYEQTKNGPCHKFKILYKDLSTKEIEVSKYSIASLEDIYKKFNFPVVVDDNYVYFYFYNRETLSFYVALEFAQSADELIVLPNKFSDDINTINYCAKYKKDRIKDIDFLHYCIDKRGWGIKSFFSNIYGNSAKTYTCGGSAVYKMPIIEYFKGLEGEFSSFNFKMQHETPVEVRNNFKELVNIVYKKYNLPVNYRELPYEFTNGLIAEDYCLDKIHSFLYEEYYYKEGFFVENSLGNSKLEKAKRKNKIRTESLKQRYEEIKQTLIKENKIPQKWKSEYELFRLVYKNYNDAVYQYHSDWLGFQSLDIYIPSLKIAIEYQGQQHYEVIEIWGGEEGLKKRQMLDEQKRKLCKENNIKLIEWKYDVPVSKVMLDKLLRE